MQECIFRIHFNGSQKLRSTLVPLYFQQITLGSPKPTCMTSEHVTGRPEAFDASGPGARVESRASVKHSVKHVSAEGRQ